MRRRVAFVGQQTYFRVCSLSSPTRSIEPLFVDYRAGADAELMLDTVRRWRADVVVVFRPETVPPGLFGSLDALTLGWNTEPMPRGAKHVHPDLLWRESELALVDPANFDRVVTFDPLSAAAAARHVPVWRSLPLPVDDIVFSDVRPLASPPRVVFIGFSTEHRERWLVEAKHRFDVLHAAHGVHDERLLELFAETDVAINLHVEPYPSFENRVSLHLAAGHLVVSEPLSPLHGLEPGIDFIEIHSPKHLEWVIDGLRRHPRSQSPVQIRGRAKAEQFRASRVYPRLIADLFADVAVFGRGRGRLPESPGVSLAVSDGAASRARSGRRLLAGARRRLHRTR